MAKVNTYGTVIPTLNDKVIGTDVSDITTDAGGQTVNILLSDLQTLMGTTLPLTGSPTFTGGPDAVLRFTKTASTDDSYVEFQTGSSGRARVGTIGNDDLRLQVSPDNFSTTYDALTVDKDTGDTTLAGAIHTFTSSTAFRPQLRVFNTAEDAFAGYFMLKKSRGSAGDSTDAVQTSDQLGVFLWQGADSDGTFRNAASITASAAAVGSGSVTANITFSAGTSSFVFSASGDLTIPRNVAAGIAISTTTFCNLAAATTAKSSLRIPSGTAPSSPVNGDIWSDGSDILVRLGGTTYTLNKT